MEMNILSIGLCLISLGLVWLTHYWYRWSNPKCINGGRLPPGSMGFPLIGETIQFFIPSKSLDMPSFVKKRISKYGPLFRTSLAGRPIVVSTDPEFNHYIFQQEGKLVQFWYLDSFTTILGEAASATTSNLIHKYLRNLILDHFGTESLKEMLLSKIEVHANQYLHSWSTQASIELKTSISSMILDLASKQIFSYDWSYFSKTMSNISTNIVQGFMSFPLNIPGTAFHKSMKNQKKALNMMRDILNERLNLPDDKKGGYDDLLCQLVEDAKMEQFLSTDLIVFILFTLFFVAIETISSTLTLGLTLLIDHPSVFNELMEEHETIFRSREDKDSHLTWKEYKSMTFTSQVINETLRMSSVAPFILRKAIKDIHINGYVIPEGWAIMVVPSALHMNPDKFKDPLTFNPHRWNDLGSSGSTKSFIPFGGGSRNCAGAEFSKSFISVFLHVLLTKFSCTKVRGAGQLSRTPVLSIGDGYEVKISERAK